MKSTMEQETQNLRIPLADRDFPASPRRVGEVMTRDAITLNPEQSFAEVVGLMANRPFHHVLVVDGEERLHGVISDRDVLRAFSRIPDWNKMSVSQIMTRNSITTTPDSLISVALRTMLDKRINCLPVVDGDGRICGILTSTDLLRAYEIVQDLIETYFPAIK